MWKCFHASKEILEDKGEMKERIKWIDVVKCFGIYGIYVLHFGELAGKSYPFLLTHLVALFFVAAGCMENYNQETNFFKYFIKKFKTIMIPFWVFAAIAAVVTIIYSNCDTTLVGGMVKEVGLGVIRNTYQAAALWFLTCLFVMQLMFFFIRKIKLKLLIIVIGLIMYLVGVYVLNPSPMWYPSWPYNIDSAIFYMIFYAIGYIGFPYVVKLFKRDTTAKKIGFGVSGILAIAYAVSNYFGIDYFAYLNLPNAVLIFIPIVNTCIVIWAFFVIACMLEDVEILNSIGRNSLYLCGCEYAVKTIATSFVGIIGYNLVLPNPLSVYIYSAILLVLANKYFVPIEQYIVKKIVK